MARKKAASKNSPELEAALASARRSEEARIERVGASGVKGTERQRAKVDTIAGLKTSPVKGTERIAGQEDQGPSAAPKPQSSTARAKRTMVAPQKKLREKGLRSAKNRELAKGVMAVTIANETPKKRTPKKRTTTKTGKKIDPKTGKIDTSKIKPGRAAKVGEKVVRVTPENVEEVKKAAVTTVLPKTKPEVERPTYELPSAGKDKLQGFSTSNPEDHKRLKDHVNQAWTHLGGMIKTRGQDEYHAHHEAFNKVHAEISAYHPSMGRILSVAHHAVHNQPDHPDTPKALTMAKQAAGDTIKAGQSASEGRAASQKKFRAERMARIRAEREGN